MPNPSLIVQMAFGQTWKSAPSSYSWTDVTSYAREVNIRRGSNDPLRSFEAGSATVTLSNPGGIFNPNTEGPYLGYIKPRVPIRIRGTYDLGISTRINLCSNPSFETNTTGWGAHLASNVRTAGTISGGAGSWSLVSTATATGTGGAFFNFTPTPGQTITASAQCFRNSGTRSYWIGFQFYNGATFISSSLGTAQTCSVSTRLSRTATVPATATNAYIIIYSSGSGSIGDALRIDSVLLEQSSTVGDYFDGSTNPNSSWTGTAHASTSQLVGRGNFITNPSIETDITGWAAGSGTTITREAVSDMIGSYAIRGERATVGTLLIEANPRISVIAGITYSFSLFLSDVNLHSGITVGISWYNQGGSLISTTSQAWPQVYGLTMGRLYATGTAPFSAVTAQPFISFASAEAGIPVYLDGFLFEASSTIKPYFDGSIPGCSWTGTAHASTSQQASTTQTLFTGYVQEFPYTFPANGNDAIVTINAVDGLGILGSVDLPDTPVLTAIATGNYTSSANTLAYFRLGDTGSQVTDSSEYGQNMATSTTPVTGSAIAGLLGQSSTFANDWKAYGAFIGDKTAYAGYWNTSFWVQTSTVASVGAANMIFEVQSQNGPALTDFDIYAAWIGSSGQVFALFYDGGNTRLTNTTVAVTDGQPHHVAIRVYNNLSAGVAPQNRISIYVDGVDQTNSTTTNTTNMEILGTLTIGAADTTNTSAFWNTIIGLNPVGFRGSLQDLSFHFLGTTDIGDALADELYGYGTGTLSETSSARITRVLNVVGWNATDRSISTTPYTTVNGWTLGENALAHLRTITEGEHSKLWFDSAGILTYTDRYAQSTRTRSRELQAFFNNLPLYWGVTRIGYSGLDWTYTAEQTINSFTVSTSNDNPQTDYNQTAIDAYGERSQSLSTFLSSTGQALTLAQMVVYENAYAAIIPSGFQVSPGTYPELEWPSLLRLELMDRVEVCFGDPNEIGPTVPRLDVTSLLQTIEITATPSQWIWNLSTTGRTEPTNYFRLDIDALDDSTKVLGF